MQRYLVALLAIASVSSMLESTFSNSVWTQKHCGVPESVHFLSGTRLLLVDRKGYCLLNLEENELEFIRTDDIDGAVLTADKHLLTLSTTHKRAQLINPLNDAVVRDYPISTETGSASFVAAGNLYLTRAAQISLQGKEKTDTKSISLDAVRILKVRSSDLGSQGLDVWAETASDAGVEICVFSVAADLSKAEKKTCHKKLLISQDPKDLLDIFADSQGQLVQLTSNHVQIGDSKEPLGPNSATRLSLGGIRQVTAGSKGPCIQKTGQIFKKVCQTDSGKVELFDESGAKVLEISAQLSKKGSITDFFVNSEGTRLLLTTDLDVLAVYDLAKGSQILQRDESLAHVEEVAFVHKKFDAEKLAYLRNYEGWLQSKNIIGAWSARIAYSLKSLGGLVGGVKEALVKFAGGLARGDVKGALGSLVDTGLSEGGQKDSKVHAPKIAVLFTRSGKIWSFDLDKLALGSQTFLKGTVRSRHQGTVDLSHSQSAPDCWLSQHGKFELLLDCRHSSGHNTAYTINADLEINKTQVPQVDQSASSTFQASASHLSGSVAGTEAWRLAIPKSQTLLRIDRIQDFKIPHASYQIENANVLYKLVDPNNALVTAREGDRLHVSIVNLKFGKVLATFVTGKAAIDLGVTTLVDDNSFFVSYFNTETLSNELLAIDIFRKRVENDFVRIIKAEFGAKERVLPDINYSAADPEYVVLHRRFGLPVHVRSMKAFDSNVDLTSKNLIIVNEQDQIYSLPRALVSARRATVAERTKAEEQLARPNKAKVDPIHYFRSLTLEPYTYFLPLTPLQFVTKNLRVAGIESVWMEPSAFESTSFLVGTGRELFVTVHSPNGAYDQLPEDFNKPLLWLLLVGFIVLITLTGRIARRKIPTQRFMQFIGA